MTHCAPWPTFYFQIFIRLGSRNRALLKTKSVHVRVGRTLRSEECIWLEVFTSLKRIRMRPDREFYSLWRPTCIWCVQRTCRSVLYVPWVNAAANQPSSHKLKPGPEPPWRAFGAHHIFCAAAKRSLWIQGETTWMFFALSVKHKMLVESRVCWVHLFGCKNMRRGRKYLDRLFDFTAI